MKTEKEVIMDQLVKFETTQLAQKKGFNLHICRCGGFPECICYDLKPTQSLLQRWLREVHGIQVYVVSGTIGGKNGEESVYKDYVAHVSSSNEFEVGKVISTAINDPRDEEYQTYEAALEAGLINALERI